MNSYKPRWEIDRLKCFESMDAYSSYHIIWSIDKTDLDGRLGNILFSSECMAGEVQFETEPNLLKLEWYLKHETESEEDGQDRWTITAIRFDSIEDYAEIPVVARFAIFDKDGGLQRRSASKLVVLTKEIDPMWTFAIDDEEKTSEWIDDFVIHLWLDVPKLVDCPKHLKRAVHDFQQQFLQQRNDFGRNLLLSSIVELFDDVISESPETSDVDLLVINEDEENEEKEERRFHCHTIVLSARSPVFRAMLVNGQFEEAQKRVVKIDDIDIDAMEIVLRYVYTGECPKAIPKSTLPSVIDAAEKYMLSELKDECSHRMINLIESDHEWIDYLHLVDTFNLSHSKKICVLALSTNMAVFADQEMREKVSPESMAELMEMATKRIDNVQVIEVEND